MRIIGCQFIALLALLFCLGTVQKQIFLDYGVGGEGRELLKYFFDVYDGFYVDIGAYDPIYASNTLNLYTMGWGGINIDASPERLNNFLMMRPDQTNLNFAIGDSDQFVTLYQLDEDSSSTVSPKVMQMVKDSKPVVKEIKVPSLSLKQVCNRYYYRKPIFMNLDIEGYGSKALQSNDWSNPKCVPQIIFSQINEQTRQSGFPLPQQILKKYGYIKQPLVVGLNQIFIHESSLLKYQQKLKSAQQYISSLSYESINSIASVLARNLSKTTQLFKHYDPTTDRLFHKFAKVDQVIDLNLLNQQSNDLAPLVLDRPIVVYHWHPERNGLVVSEGKFTVSGLRVQFFDFWEVRVRKNNGKNFSVYIFDHKHSDTQLKPPTIIDSSSQYYLLQNQKQSIPPPQTPQNLSKQQLEQELKVSKLLREIAGELKKQENLLARLENGSALQTSQLKDTFVRNHNVEINILESVSAKVVGFQRKLAGQGERAKNMGKEKGKIAKSLGLDIKNLMVIQSITLVLILILSISLCVTVCVLSKKNKKHQSQLFQSHQKLAESATNITSFDSAQN